jgi:hypothetical protein
VPGIKVDGMNVLNVREATLFAKAYASISRITLHLGEVDMVSHSISARMT